MSYFEDMIESGMCYMCGDLIEQDDLSICPDCLKEKEKKQKKKRTPKCN